MAAEGRAMHRPSPEVVLRTNLVSDAMVNEITAHAELSGSAGLVDRGVDHVLESRTPGMDGHAQRPRVEAMLPKPLFVNVGLE